MTVLNIRHPFRLRLLQSLVRGRGSGAIRREALSGHLGSSYVTGIMPGMIVLAVSFGLGFPPAMNAAL